MNESQGENSVGVHRCLSTGSTTPLNLPWHTWKSRGWIQRPPKSLLVPALSTSERAQGTGTSQAVVMGGGCLGQPETQRNEQENSSEGAGSLMLCINLQPWVQLPELSTEPGTQ